MICPQQDGQLVTKTVPRPGDTPLTYSVCPTCGGTWLKAFDANFLPLLAARELEKELAAKPVQSKSLNNQKAASPASLVCPSCGFKLVKATAVSIPEDVLLWRCPNGHGYFFPAGELSKFKAAQEAKITYHKLWQIPLTSVAATLLTGIVGIILSVGLVLGVIGGQEKQAIVSQAKNILSFQKAYISGTGAVTFIATTSQKTILTVHIIETQYVSNLQTTDKKSHVLRVLNIPKGEYNYYFTFEVEGKTLRSESYSFSIPSNPSTPPSQKD